MDRQRLGRQRLGRGGRTRRLNQTRRVRVVAWRVRIPLALLAFTLVYGTVGYAVLEHFSILDSVYMTLTTLTTVGFGEIHPLSQSGRVFTMTVIVFGVLGTFGLLAEFTALLASGQVGKFLERRSMQREIRDLEHHYVICAYGRVGRAAAQELVEQGAQVVVIESKVELEPMLVQSGLPYLVADPTQESVLEEAGIHRAEALLCAVDSDAINVYITLTARAMNPNLFIIARASSPDAVDKLERAGSNRVVSPYTVSGARMASLGLSPAVIEFAEMVSVAPDLRIEELVVGEGSPMAPSTVRQVCEPYEGVMVLAVKRPAGELVVPPGADTIVNEGDVLIILGPAEPLAQLAKQAT
ncbi:MAG TPA: potassium channel protein [Acidimicrobiales bacterium]|nr:potassium channel protein [Acidimicrobiales bacterium]